MEDYRIMTFKSTILTCLFAVAMVTPVMAESVWAPSEMALEQYKPETKCYVNGSNVRIQNGNGQILEVYNVTGVRILAFRIDTDDKTVNVSLPKGIYIIKVGSFVRKISLR